MILKKILFISLCHKSLCFYSIIIELFIFLFCFLRERENIIFIFYEDMKKDLKSVINKVSAFLGKELSGEQVKYDIDCGAGFGLGNTINTFISLKICVVCEGCGDFKPWML